MLGPMAQGFQHHPFYKPLWRRLVLVAVTVAWVAFELWQGGSGLWLVIAAASAVYATWILFTWKDGPAETK